MQWFEVITSFLVELFRVIAWPGVVLAVAILLKNDLRSAMKFLAQRVSSIIWSDFKVELGGHIQDLPPVDNSAPRDESS